MAGKGMRGLALLIGHGKPSDDDGAGPDSSEGSSGDAGPKETKYLTHAFEALKDDDIEGFRMAMSGAIRACIDAKGAGEYDDEGEEGE